jgi:hypothetical protein
VVELQPQQSTHWMIAPRVLGLQLPKVDVGVQLVGPLRRSQSSSQLLNRSNVKYEVMNGMRLLGSLSLHNIGRLRVSKTHRPGQLMGIRLVGTLC